MAALSIGAPVTRMEGATLRRYVRPVTEAAAAISRRMGYAEAPARKEGSR